MNEKSAVPEDEISLIDLWNKVRWGWMIVVGGLVLGSVAAGLACVVLSPKFEAVVLVQVGQIGQVIQGNVSSSAVEPPVQAVERMKTPAFQHKVAEALQDQHWLRAIAGSASGTTRDLSAHVLKGAGGTEIPLIELRARAESPESARQRAEGVVAQLAKAHTDLAQPVLASMQADLALTRERLANAERGVAEMTKMIAGASIKSDHFTQLALISWSRTQAEAEVLGRRQAVLALERALGTPATQEAKVIEAVFVSEKPVYPKKPLLLLLGAVGGLLAGLVCVFVVDALRLGRSVAPPTDKSGA